MGNIGTKFSLCVCIAMDMDTEIYYHSFIQENWNSSTDRGTEPTVLDEQVDENIRP